ncbi:MULTISPECIES: TolC family protein [unclassified Sphingobium]|uniref:TolC family protein n=1 Tax=unclassified Sphingobium TaxID=2611147 RepID=UPI000D155DF8|nr:transporter [Sphingobium sp. AEW4]TWD03638.1 outer membrane protein TolC [Sphingobium sp. AEW010]TWD21159.1 outer membrane protein TolC [Sphingobium sp. AEW013]TWD23801.1 outer membrane protein TolC [Sphingobium sp. AEW001]
MRLFYLAPIIVAIPGMALAGPLTFDAALERAQHQAPSLQAKALGADAARSARGAAGALPDPALGVSVESFPISGPLAFEPRRDDFTMARVGVSQDIPNLAKRHAQQARAESDIKAAEADIAVEARTVEVGTALAWINLAYAERRLAALDNVLSRLEHVVGTTPAAVASGNARPAQTLAGQQAVAAMQDRRSELVSSVARARATLTRWTGETGPEIAGPIPDFPIEPITLRANLDRHPTIRMVEAQSSQADADVRLADAGRRSDFGVNVAYQRRDPRFGDYVSAGVTVSLPFFTRNRQNAGIAAAQANAGRVLAEREATRRALAADLETDLADHVMHHEQWMRARDTLQPLADQRVRLETASYGAGRASLVDIADAYVALADATLSVLDREALVAADGARLTLTYRSDDR